VFSIACRNATVGVNLIVSSVYCSMRCELYKLSKNMCKLETFIPFFTTCSTSFCPSLYIVVIICNFNWICYTLSVSRIKEIFSNDMLRWLCVVSSSSNFQAFILHLILFSTLSCLPSLMLSFNLRCCLNIQWTMDNAVLEKCSVLSSQKLNISSRELSLVRSINNDD
jgi:hypothetical protein